MNSKNSLMVFLVVLITLPGLAKNQRADFDLFCSTPLASICDTQIAQQQDDSKLEIELINLALAELSKMHPDNELYKKKFTPRFDTDYELNEVLDLDHRVPFRLIFSKLIRQKFFSETAQTINGMLDTRFVAAKKFLKEAIRSEKPAKADAMLKVVDSVQIYTYESLQKEDARWQELQAKSGLDSTPASEKERLEKLYPEIRKNYRLIEGHFEKFCGFSGFTDNGFASYDEFKRPYFALCPGQFKNTLKIPVHKFLDGLLQVTIHEVAHSIHFSFFPKAAESILAKIGYKGTLKDEASADAWAALALGHYMKSMNSDYIIEFLKLNYANYCGDNSSSAHPDGDIRVGQILAKSSTIRKTLNCRN